jgi:hypothetical protein
MVAYLDQERSGYERRRKLRFHGDPDQASDRLVSVGPPCSRLEQASHDCIVSS